MKNRSEICICGHNKLSHNWFRGSWKNIISGKEICIVWETSCKIETCRCETYKESELSRHERSKSKNKLN